MENRNPLCRMFNLKSGRQDTASKPVDLDDSSASPQVASRPNLFSRLHQNLKRDRRDHRSKLVDQNRVLDTPKAHVTQSTTNLHQHVKKPLAAANSVSNLASSHNESSKSKFTSIFSKFPTKKPPVTAAATSSAADNTYTVPNESHNDSNLNTSKSENASSLRRRKMLEEYLKSKRERQQQDKKKPAFKVGLAGSSNLGISASMSKLNTSSCNSSNSGIVPSRPTFDFKMSLPKPEIARTASMKISSTASNARSANLARSNTIKDHSKPASKPSVTASSISNKPVTRSNTLKPATKPSIPSRPAPISGTGVQRTASTVKSTPSGAFKPKLPASKHQKDMELISKKLTDSVRLNNQTTPSLHAANINSESIIIVDSHNHDAAMQNVSMFGNIKNLILEEHKSHHLHHRTSSPIKVDLGKICSSPIVPRQLVSQLVRGDSIEDAVQQEQDQSMQLVLEKTQTAVSEEVAVVETKPVVQSLEYFDGVEMSNRDVEYYRSLLSFQTRRLNSLIDEWTAQLDVTQLAEDTQGDIRLACGLAKLLIDERFVQFNGLVNQCEQQNLYDSLNAKDKVEETGEEAELKVRCTDLQGFWDMVDSQVIDVAKRFEKLARLRANNYMPIEEEVKVVKKKPAAKPKKKEVVIEESKDVESAPVPKKANKFAEFRAKMKAQKQQTEGSDDVIIEIKTGTPSIKPTTPVAEEPKSNAKKSGGRRKSRVSQIAEQALPQSPYNLRSRRKSDLISFDSPMSRESLMVSKLPSMPEESIATGQSEVNVEPPVIKINKPRKSVRINMEPMVQLVDQDEYAEYDNDNDKENEDFFAYDIKKEVVTWRSNENIANRLSFLPKFESPIRILSNNNTLAATPNRTHTNSNLLDVTPATGNASTRLSISMANSPLLKLAFISSKSKRLSMTNQSVLDNNK